MRINKIDVDPDYVVKTLYAFLDKKHTTRIAAFLSGITDESKKKIPNWMLLDIEIRLKGEPDYINNYFPPSVIKNRVESVIEGGEWLGFININGGNANLDILLHTVKKGSNKFNIIERIYYYTNIPSFGEIDFFRFIEENKIQIRAPKLFGFLRENNYFFYFNEYISNGRHPTQREINNGLMKRIMHHLWSLNFGNDLVYKKNINYEILKEKVTKNLCDLGYEKIVFELEKNSENSKKFILHTDLHCLNIILAPNDDFYLIDWVSWRFSSVGMGVNIRDIGVIIDEITYDDFIKLVFDFYDNSFGVSEKVFLSNFTFFNVINIFEDSSDFSVKLLSFYNEWCLKMKVNYD